VPDFDLTATLRDLASRNPGRSEADIQAMVRDVLVYGGFDLGDEAVALESPTEDRRRLDVSVGAVIIECKRDLRTRAQPAKAEGQLGEYLAAKGAGRPGTFVRAADSACSCGMPGAAGGRVARGGQAAPAAVLRAVGIAEGPAGGVDPPQAEARSA
jgi:hypothetical protein